LRSLGGSNEQTLPAPQSQRHPAQGCKEKAMVLEAEGVLTREKNGIGNQ